MWHTIPCQLMTNPCFILFLTLCWSLVVSSSDSSRLPLRLVHWNHLMVQFLFDSVFTSDCTKVWSEDNHYGSILPTSKWLEGQATPGSIKHSNAVWIVCIGSSSTKGVPTPNYIWVLPAVPKYKSLLWSVVLICSWSCDFLSLPSDFKLLALWPLLFSYLLAAWNDKLMCGIFVRS